MPSTPQCTRDVITIKGSTAIVTEFFGYALNSILYQRGIYPEEKFTRTKKYGLPMLICKDPGVSNYLKNIMVQLSEWLVDGSLQQLVMVIASLNSKEVLERWAFRIETDQEVLETGGTKQKSDKVIAGEIQAIIRQITSSVTFLPLLDEPCTFDLLAYTAQDVEVPALWEESDPRLIVNSQDVKLRSFNTKVHQVDTMVAFRREDDEC